MSEPDVASTLRPDLLEGAVVVFAGGPAGAARGLCTALGARTSMLEGDLLDEDGVTTAASGADDTDVLVADAAALYAQAGGGPAGLRTATDGSFGAIRAVARNAWIPDEGEDGRPGKVIVLTPPPGAGAHAGAAAAALENTMRTLSTEWARYAITTVAVHPGDASPPDRVAELLAWLASPAGDYVTGTALRLR